MKRRNLLKGLLGLPLVGSRGKAKPVAPKPEPVAVVNVISPTAMSFTVREWAAPQHELDRLELEIQTLRANRKA